MSASNGDGGTAAGNGVPQFKTVWFVFRGCEELKLKLKIRGRKKRASESMHDVFHRIAEIDKTAAAVIFHNSWQLTRLGRQIWEILFTHPWLKEDKAFMAGAEAVMEPLMRPVLVPGRIAVAPKLVDFLLMQIEVTPLESVWDNSRKCKTITQEDIRRKPHKAWRYAVVDGAFVEWKTRHELGLN